MSKVAILTFDKIAMFELACAIEIFALPRPEYKKWYETDVVCFDKGDVLATGGIKISTKCVKDFSDYQTLVIPS